jgi:hypothetical protein
MTVKSKPLRYAFDARLRDFRPRKDKRGFDLISDALPFGRLRIAPESFLIAGRLNFGHPISHRRI